MSRAGDGEERGRGNDPDGKEVVLLQQTWEAHIRRRHPELEDAHAEMILRALKCADVRPAAIADRKRFVIEDPTGITNSLVVVVDYADDPPLIITVIPHSREPR